MNGETSCLLEIVKVPERDTVLASLRYHDVFVSGRALNDNIVICFSGSAVRRETQICGRRAEDFQRQSAGLLNYMFVFLASINNKHVIDFQWAKATASENN